MTSLGRFGTFTKNIFPLMTNCNKLGPINTSISPSSIFHRESSNDFFNTKVLGLGNNFEEGYLMKNKKTKRVKKKKAKKAGKDVRFPQNFFTFNSILLKKKKKYFIDKLGKSKVKGELFSLFPIKQQLKEIIQVKKSAFLD